MVDYDRSKDNVQQKECTPRETFITRLLEQGERTESMPVAHTMLRHRMLKYAVEKGRIQLEGETLTIGGRTLRDESFSM